MEVPLKFKGTARDKADEFACRYPSCPGRSRNFQPAPGEAGGGPIDTAWPACFGSQALHSMMMIQFISCVKSAVLYLLSYPEYSGTGLEPATPANGKQHPATQHIRCQGRRILWGHTETLIRSFAFCFLHAFSSTIADKERSLIPYEGLKPS